MNRPARLQPSRVEALHVLGVASGASTRQIKGAYRRLALRYHPDRNRNQAGGLPEDVCAARFREVVQAYRLLIRHASHDPNQCTIDPCSRCRAHDRLQRGLDGNMYCRACLLMGSSCRALPAPPVVIVGGGLAAGLLLASTLLLVAWSATAQVAYWAAAMGLTLTSLAVLSVVCIRVGYAATRRDLALARGRSVACGRTSGSG